MKTKTINLYLFDELTAEQQAQVIEKYRYFNDDLFQLDVEDESTTQEIYEAGFLNPTIYYNLDNCQGSGACFDCSEFDFDKLLKDWERPHKNWMIHIIKVYCEGAIETVNNRYYHSNTRRFHLADNLPCKPDRYTQEALTSAKAHIERLRDNLSKRLEIRLRQDLDYLRSDESIASTLRANEYYFNEDTLEIEY